MDAADDHLAALGSAIRGRGRLVVGFSGGVDSAVLAASAQRVIGGRAVAVTVASESLARVELEEAATTAGGIGIRHRIVTTSDLANPLYVANPANRCYYCRQDMSRALLQEAASLGIKHVAMGVNASDLGEWRPGIQASREAGIWMPFLELGVDKAGVRALARALGLRVADKPSMACLSSRIPHGETITAGKLARVERAEEAVRALGFVQIRVRSHGDVASVEVERSELPRAVAAGGEIRRALVDAGFRHVTLDAAGYRPGSLSGPLRVRA